MNITAPEVPHLLLPCYVSLLRLFTQNALVEPGPQHTHGSVSVLQLRASLLTFRRRPCLEGRINSKARWQQYTLFVRNDTRTAWSSLRTARACFTGGKMDNANCAVSCVDTLAPGTSRSERVDAKILRIEVDVQLAHGEEKGLIFTDVKRHGRRRRRTVGVPPLAEARRSQSWSPCGCAASWRRGPPPGSFAPGEFLLHASGVCTHCPRLFSPRRGADHLRGGQANMAVPKRFPSCAKA